MSPEEQIAKLEALLARVLSRKRNGGKGAHAPLGALGAIANGKPADKPAEKPAKPAVEAPSPAIAPPTWADVARVPPPAESGAVLSPAARLAAAASDAPPVAILETPVVDLTGPASAERADRAASMTDRAGPLGEARWLDEERVETTWFDVDRLDVPERLNAAIRAVKPEVPELPEPTPLASTSPDAKADAAPPGVHEANWLGGEQSLRPEVPLPREEPETAGQREARWLGGELSLRPEVPAAVTITGADTSASGQKEARWLGGERSLRPEAPASPRDAKPASSTPPPAARPTAPPMLIAPADASLDRSIEAVIASPRRPLAPEVSEVRVVSPPVPPAPSPESSVKPDAPRAAEPPPMEVVELDIDGDPSVAPPVAAVDNPFESRSRLVSAPPATSFDPIDDDAIAPLPPSDPTIEVGAVEVSPGDLAALEEERPPSSSRRPISLEDKMAEEDDAVPLHPAPPKSGPLPAATPAIELGFEPDPSTGVRRFEAKSETKLDASAPASPVPTVTVAPPQGAAVARFVGHAPKELAAATFGELLDATLSL